MIRKALPIVLILLLLTACGSSTESGGSASENPETAAPSEEWKNGSYAEFYSNEEIDTALFSIYGDMTGVRFIGIKSEPVSEEDPWTVAAFEYVSNRLRRAESIFLEYDPDAPETDDDGYLTAWVWVDDSLLQTELLELGYAESSELPDECPYEDELQEAQDYARDSYMGMWAVREANA